MASGLWSFVREPMSSVALSAASPIPHIDGVTTDNAFLYLSIASPPSSRGCHIRAAMTESDDPNKLRLAPGVIKETVLKVVPETVRHLPWDKAEGVLISKAIFIGHKAN